MMAYMSWFAVMELLGLLFKRPDLRCYLDLTQETKSVLLPNMMSNSDFSLLWLVKTFSRLRVFSLKYRFFNFDCVCNESLNSQNLAIYREVKITSGLSCMWSSSLNFKTPQCWPKSLAAFTPSFRPIIIFS